MLYQINNGKLEQCGQTWHHKELEIEKLIVSTTNEDNPILSEDIFGEELFYIDRQIINSDNKRFRKRIRRFPSDTNVVEDQERESTGLA